MKLGHRELRVALIVATGFIGCADGKPSTSKEEIAEAAQAWGTAACSTATANTSRSVTISPFLSPQSYDTCKKSYVVDLFNYASTPSGVGGTNGLPFDGGIGTGGTASGPGVGEPNLTVRWGDSLPTTQVECEASLLGGIFYRRVFVPSPDGGTGSGSWVWSEPTGQVRQNGIWSDGECRFPPVVHAPLEVGESYRVAATARTSADQTRRVSIRTEDPDLP